MPRGPGRRRLPGREHASCAGPSSFLVLSLLPACDRLARRRAAAGLCLRLEPSCALKPGAPSFPGPPGGGAGQRPSACPRATFEPPEAFPWGSASPPSRGGARSPTFIASPAPRPRSYLLRRSGADPRRRAPSTSGSAVARTTSPGSVHSSGLASSETRPLGARLRPPVRGPVEPSTAQRSLARRAHYTPHPRPTRTTPSGSVAGRPDLGCHRRACRGNHPGRRGGSRTAGPLLGHDPRVRPVEGPSIESRRGRRLRRTRFFARASACRVLAIVPGPGRRFQPTTRTWFAQSSSLPTWVAGPRSGGHPAPRSTTDARMDRGRRGRASFAARPLLGAERLRRWCAFPLRPTWRRPLYRTY